MKARRRWRTHVVVGAIMVAAPTLVFSEPAAAQNGVTGPSPSDFCRHIDSAPATYNTDELHCLSASSNYQVASVAVAIPGGLTSRSRMQSFLADIDADGRPDFCRLVDTPPTGSGSDELHCASAASNYQSAIPGVVIPGGYTSRHSVQTSMPDVDGDHRADLCRVYDTPPTPSNGDELRCMSGASQYQMPAVAAAIPGGFTDRTRVQTFLADVDGDTRADLCRHVDAAPTASNTDELACVSAASNYGALVVAAAIPGGYTDRARMQTYLADIDGDGRADLCRHIDTAPTGSNSDELHCASAASNYQTPVLGVALPGGFSQRSRVESAVGWNHLTALDTAAPWVTGVTTPPANAAGWHRQPTTINWQSIDPPPTSGLPSTPPPTFVSQEGRNASYQSEPSCDPARHCSTGRLSVSLDMTAPGIQGTVSPDANAAGWRRAATVDFACSDALSGVASCPIDIAVPEGRDRTVTGTAFDIAGNPGSVTVSGLNVDNTAPEVLNTTRDGSVFIQELDPVDLRGGALDWALADGSPGSGVVSACFEITRTWPILFDDEPFGCVAASQHPNGTWAAFPSLATGSYRVRLTATDAAGNTGFSDSVTIHVVNPTAPGLPR